MLELNIKLGTFFVVLVAFFEFISKFQLATWFLLFHLAYYNIAHRISILKTVIDDSQYSAHRGLKIAVLPMTSKQNDVISQRLQKVGNLFDHLAKAAHQLKTVFSLAALVVLSTSFLSCTVCLFVFIHELFKPTAFQKSLYLQLFLVATHIAMALIVILSADLPSQQVLWCYTYLNRSV